MGSVMRKRVVNVYDIPQDILVEVVGGGMKLNVQTTPPTLEVSMGTGMKLDKQDRVAMDTDVDEEKSTQYTQMTDSSLSVDGRKIILTKSYTDYKVKRNKDGVVFDIETLGVREETQELVLTDIGYVAALSKSERTGDPVSPNFYKQQ